MIFSLAALFTIIEFSACDSGNKTSVLNETASLPENNMLPQDPLLEHPFTSSINLKDSTMSTLYGNSIAWEYAQKKNDGNYPPGAILYEVTWNQKPDSVWWRQHSKRDQIGRAYLLSGRRTVKIRIV